MSDLKTLDDAFAELERRADTYGLAEATTSGYRPAARTHRALLAAASVVAVAAVATTVAVLAGNGSDTSGSGQQPGRPAGAPPHSSAPPSASLSSAPVGVPKASSSPVVGSLVPAPPASTKRPPSPRVPQTAAQLAQRLRTVLGGKANFTWSAPAGAGTPVITGILTRTSPHRRGGFDLQVDVGSPGDTAICEDPGPSTCTVRRLADHSSLSVGREIGAGTLYFVDLVRPDGISLLMHVSTRSDPKGAGANYGTTPPLSIKEMARLLESPEWLG